MSVVVMYVYMYGSFHMLKYIGFVGIRNEVLYVQPLLFLFKHILSFSLAGMLRKTVGGGGSAARRSSDDYVAPDEHRHRRKVRVNE